MYYLMLPLLVLMADDKALKPIEPAILDRKEPIDYVKDVAPIFSAKCTSCHTGSVNEGGYSMANYANLLKGGKRGVAIVPGQPAESNLYLFSSHARKPIMPPKSDDNALSPAQVAILKRWIEEGAKTPKEAETKTRSVVVLTLPPALVNPVRALAVHPTSNLIAAGRGNQLVLIDAKSGDVVSRLVDPSLKTKDGKPANAAHISLVESLAFSPDGTILATGSFREVVLWSVDKKTILARITDFADKVNDIAWSPKGDLFATAGGAPTEDGEIRIFDKVGKLVLNFKSPHSDSVFGVAFSPDGTKLASASADRFVRIFELPGGKLIKSFEGHTQHVLDVAWGPDGKRFASAGADSLIKIWDLDKGERVRELKNHKNQVTRLAFVGKTINFLSASGDGTARRWSIESGDGSRSFEGAKDFLYAIAASADGSIIATGGEEGLVRVYDGKNGKLEKTVTFEPQK